MAVNPQLPLGNLNRLRPSLVIPSYPALNVTASYVGKRGIRLDFASDLTQQIDVMTGVVPSPEPYVVIDMTANILKTNGLAAAWIAQIELNTFFGNITLHTDTSAYPAFNFAQCAVARMPGETFEGTEAAVDFVIRGQWIINNNLWNLA